MFSGCMCRRLSLCGRFEELRINAVVQCWYPTPHPTVAATGSLDPSSTKQLQAGRPTNRGLELLEPSGQHTWRWQGRRAPPEETRGPRIGALAWGAPGSAALLATREDSELRRGESRAQPFLGAAVTLFLTAPLSFISGSSPCPPSGCLDCMGL